ncbi:MAG TPA: hypothetical protein VIK99_07115 [Thermaerobacter sp.]
MRDDEKLASCSQPLYRTMERKGFRHAAERTLGGDWRITFWRS